MQVAVRSVVRTWLSSSSDIVISKQPRLQAACRMYSSGTKTSGGVSSGGDDSPVLLTKTNQIGCITLNRPKQLNALNLPMVQLMRQHLDECARDDQVRAVIVKGAGAQAFCAGGDVKSIRDLCVRGERARAMQFFEEEYSLNYQISTYGKPYIALIDGVTMGGGVGVSVHGRYRVATERTLFAMPETAIGFFADVGGSYFLSRLRGHLGAYLVLTGNRLKGRDVQSAGVATHFVHSGERLAQLEAKLCAASDLTPQSVEALLAGFDEPLVAASASAAAGCSYDAAKVAQVFGEKSLESILAKLQADNSEWSRQQLKLMDKMSPTSLKVAVRQLLEGSTKSLKECLEMEYQLCLRFTSQNDFAEGVRAVLVDRDNKPVWKPAELKLVTDQQIDWYFKPIDGEMKLVLSS